MSLGFLDMIMLNPEIIHKSLPYVTEEGCLCLQGARKTKRYRRIRVRYQDESFQEHTQDFEGRIAQIIQHECELLDGAVMMSGIRRCHIGGCVVAI